MSSSESEEFESADEDFQDEILGKLQAVKSDEQKVQKFTETTFKENGNNEIPVKLKPHHPDNNNSFKSTTHRAKNSKREESTVDKFLCHTPPEHEECCEPVDEIDPIPIPDNKKEEIIIDSAKCEATSGIRNSSEEKKETHIDRSKCVVPPKRVECWFPEVNVRKEKIEKSADVKNKNVEELKEDIDGYWAVDDWGENAIDYKLITDAFLQEKNTDGWGDDDDGWGDWGDTDSPKKQQTNQNLDNMKSVFPVLDQISPSRENTSSMSLNLSKSSSINSQNMSNYDIFPVLNDLSPNKRTSINNIDQNELQTPQEQEPQRKDSGSSYWGGWKPWGGMVSLISTATESVTTLTTHVSQGLSNVIETSIGVPDPEELARLQATKEKESVNRGISPSASKESPEDDSREDKFRQSFGNIVSGVTNIGNKVITGGLDTLEGIGKKTMTILQENDPLLLNKRKLLGMDNEKPNLSQILREAKEKTEETENHLKQIQKHLYKKQLHFETLFDHYHGLVHLEALEMLSKQSSMKLQSFLEPLTGKALVELQETLNEVKELCELGEMDNDEADGTYSAEELTEKYLTAIEDLGVEVDLSDILNCWRENTNWLDSNLNAEPQEIYDKALRCLAETSAIAVHKMHKIAELILIKDHHSTANEADSLVQLTTTSCWHLSGIANRFGGRLDKCETNEENSSLITSIFIEVSNSTSYIQSAFQLFIPILQIGAA